ncbi:prepilin-type N-terminal cleavage/methylation domain-containing protein [Vibrio fortis]|uniref:prepilin-type N-terminal cleavage/methylation domain-containing protein n=1 Tax=Vibrio fortis TaxID=212667 RepID=UPI000AC3C9CA|nr:prepilin-type N-terminal cleavage/methylation domain-containing protein [Vibrio fortis]
MKKDISKASYRGFTLIEMLVAVVIIVVLSVIALPRFLNIQDDGRIALFEGAESQFQSAITFAHSKWLVSGGGNAEMNDMPGFGEDEDGNAQLDINDVGYPLGVIRAIPWVSPTILVKEIRAASQFGMPL